MQSVSRRGTVVAALTALIWGVHCGGGDNSTFANNSCESMFGKSACTQQCGVGTPCPTGMFCSNGTCTAQCSPKASCGGQWLCSGDGHCVGEGSSVFSGEGTTEQSGGGGCVDGVVVPANRVTPTVILLVDQSGSMTSKFGTTSRWLALRGALMSDTGVVKTLESEVRFGLALFSGETGGTCPELAQIAPKFGSYDAINATYQAASPLNNTPTAESFRQVVGLADNGMPFAGGFAATPLDGPKLVILATDGDPDTCAEPDANGTQPPKDKTVAAVQDGYKAGVETVVVAVGPEVTESHQKAVANAGVGKDPTTGDAPYYRPSTQDQLAAALRTIIDPLRSCSVTLHGTVDPAHAAEGTVTLDGKPLVYNDPNGWKLVSSRELQLLGTACASLQNGAKLDVSFPCGTATADPMTK
jgi:hypothetical protein